MLQDADVHHVLIKMLIPSFNKGYKLELLIQKKKRNRQYLIVLACDSLNIPPLIVSVQIILK